MSAPKKAPSKKAIAPIAVVSGLWAVYQAAEAYLSTHPQAAALAAELEADAAAWVKGWIAAHTAPTPPSPAA
jgi:hypothetical protein